MSNYQLHKSIDILPPDLQEEVATFVAFLCFKKAITIPPDQQKLPLKFGAAKGKIRYSTPDWHKDLDSEFDIFNGKES